VPATLRFMLGVETKVQQGIVVRARDHDYIAATPAVAAAGSAARNKLLAPERKTPIAAVSSFNRNLDFVDEQGNCLSFGANADELAEPPTIAKLHNAWDFRKQGIVLAAPNVLAGFEACPALSHQNRSPGDRLAAEPFHAEPLRVRIPVSGRLRETSDLLIHQLRAIDNRRLVQGPLAQLSPALMREVAGALRDVLDLDAN